MEFNPANLPAPFKILWVEALEPSTQLRDIVIKAEYRGESFTVKATAIWAEKTDFRKAGNMLSADADSRDIQRTFGNQLDSKLGLFGVATNSPRTGNGMEMEFTVKPTGIAREPGVKFDISRSKEAKVWFTLGANRVLVDSHTFNSFKDNPNDDPRSNGEDNSPKNDHIYSIDGPGFKSNNTGGFSRAEFRANFVEFVRMRFGKKFENKNGTNAAPEVEGTRASDHVAWRARLDVIDDGTGQWKRNNNPGENEIELGHKALGN